MSDLHPQARERLARRVILKRAAELKLEVVIRDLSREGWQLVGKHPVTGKPCFARRPTSNGAPS